MIGMISYRVETYRVETDSIEYHRVEPNESGRIIIE